MKVKIIECPRDAMQGLSKIIDTDSKVNYINTLLKVGFDTLDCGSFVNPKIIPQMADTEEVLKRINMTETKLSVIVANQRGAESAVNFDQITYLGYPFSISEVFQKRNTNTSIHESLNLVEQMIQTCEKHNKKFITYVSMCFGNPYNETWNEDLVIHWIKHLKERGAHYFSLSDTIGVSNPERISKVIKAISSEFNNLNFGCHFHTRPTEWQEKIETAYASGCYRFDGALKGFGGCPMADDHLVGNMPTENLVGYFNNLNIDLGLKMEEFNKAMLLANQIFDN